MALTTLAHSIAAAIRKTEDEDGFRFEEVMSDADIATIARLAAEIAAGENDDHRRRSE